MDAIFKSKKKKKEITREEFEKECQIDHRKDIVKQINKIEPPKPPPKK